MNLPYIDGKICNGSRLLNISVQCYIKIMSIVLYCKAIIDIFCIPISWSSKISWNEIEW